MKGWMICFALAACLSAAACGPRGPAYKDVNVNQSAANQAAGNPAGGSPPGNANAAALPSAPVPPQAFKMPAFMDAATGAPKDLPNYPGSRVLNIQYGPQNDTDTFSVLLQTGDSMEKIAAFYDKAAKSNGWDVTQRQVDPEYSEWRLRKNASDEAQVTVRKPPQGNMLAIAVARTAKQAQPPQPKP
jgi:hypothetical protein